MRALILCLCFGQFLVNALFCYIMLVRLFTNGTISYHSKINVG